jgi:hypothetical protein
VNDKPEMPAFVFKRRRDIEIEAGFLLAGNLAVDIPKGVPVEFEPLTAQHTLRQHWYYEDAPFGSIQQTLRPKDHAAA